jgi:TrmH family RNA methyltransferase
VSDKTPRPDARDGAPAGNPLLDNIVIVLSHTTEPGNIGAACRAMKTMGLSRLRLINPLNPKGRTAYSLAHGAEDVLEAAEIVTDLESAISDAIVVAGTTSRKRAMRKHALLSPDELAHRLLGHAAEGTVVLLFGTERVGLVNQETDVCRYLSTVDTATSQPSLNLAQAVMLYAWELRKACLTGVTRRGRPPEMYVCHPHRSTKLPTQFELDMMYAHLAQAMEALAYSDFELRKFITYLRHMHMRAGIVDWELQIYHLLARRILKSKGLPKFTSKE